MQQHTFHHLTGRLLTAVALCLLTATAAQAQYEDSPPPVFTIGPKVGVNYSTLVADNEVDAKYIVGYNAGLFARLNLGRVYLQPEATFNLKGSNLTVRQPNGGQNVSTNVRFNQIDVPVLLGVYLLGNDNFNLRLMGGPMISFITNSDQDNLASLGNEAFAYRDRVWGAAAGLGLDLGNISVDARYETGLQDVSDRFSQRQRLFQLSLGFRIF